MSVCLTFDPITTVKYKCGSIMRCHVCVNYNLKDTAKKLKGDVLAWPRFPDLNAEEN